MTARFSWARAATSAKLLDQVSTAAEAVRFRVQQARRRRQALLALKNEVVDTRENKAPYRLRKLQETYAEAGLAAENWNDFLHPH